MPRVIIADDNQALLDLLSEFSRRAGWTPETCLTGAQIKDAIGSGTEPALLLIDIMMPVMDGIEAIDQISEIDRQLRIRFMTGGNSASLIAAKLIASARGLQVGRNIFKPIGREKYLQILEEEASLLGELGHVRSGST
ncbi:response regulator [Salipiger sp. 1_MG-2023]|uniref:response regulator n=1 Tax=Salipiger sp. 1_MG-2023 TaxID=3062665 RepID=UPI0026E3D1AC|nr:response regulator [Salipiger sp. 1_MG-2023]MDO6585744.1 response regulator [Salipiger sp. 1_MG-2023]